MGYPGVQLNADQISACLEAYLIWLMGKTMFTENHVDTISARFIEIAREIAWATCADQITQRSWGSAVLAATYRGMCKACQLSANDSGLLGCPLLLQLWSWERFQIGRPAVDIDEAFPPDLIFDDDGIDMPTFATVWTRREVCLTFESTALPFIIARRYAVLEQTVEICRDGTRLSR